MLNNLPATILDGFPADLLQIVENVARKTGIEVEAMPYSKDILVELPHMTKSQAVLDIDPDRSSITIWYDPDRLTASTLAHELLHLRRNILESVPKLFPLNEVPASASDEVYSTENELEHLIIVPEQIKHFPEAEEWWATHYLELSERIHAGNMTLFYAWSFVRNVLPEHEQLASRYASLLRQYNIVRPADYFREDMRIAAQDKFIMIKRLLDGFPQLRQYCDIGRYVVVQGSLTLQHVNLD